MVFQWRFWCILLDAYRKRGDLSKNLLRFKGPTIVFKKTILYGDLHETIKLAATSEIGGQCL